MATLPSSVRPGDLITSNLVNEILSHLRDHDTRLIVLEGGSAGAGQVIISDVLPGDLVQVGQTIQILGSNFDASVGAHRAYFDTQPVTEFLEATNNMLRLKVPPLPGLPALGKAVTLNVSNLTSSATRQLTVTPLPTNVTGVVDVASTSAPNPVPAGANADFGFTLTSRASVTDAEFVLGATITGPAWQDRIRLLDGSKVQLEGNRIRLTKNVATPVFVRINPVPPGSDNTAFDLMLSVDAQAGSATGDSDVKSYTVGVTTTPEDAVLTITSITSDPAGAHSGGTIAAGVGNGVLIRANIALLSGAPTNVALTLTPTAPTGGGSTTNWLLAWLDPSPTTGPTQSQVNGLTTAGRTIEFFVEPQNSSATSPGRMQLRVQRSGVTTFKTVNFTLQRN